MSAAGGVGLSSLPLARYYDVLSMISKFLKYFGYGLEALFFILVTYNIFTQSEIFIRTNDIVRGIELFVSKAIMPLTWLLASIFAIKILAKIFENEAKAVEEHIREKLVGELVLRGRLNLNEVKERYGFKNTSSVFKLLKDGLTKLGLRATLDQTGNEVYIS